MKLTDEQLAIVRHDLNAHAKVLAIAGAGKTTTMVERVEYLVRQCHVSQRAIRVVMFNKRIQEEFQNKVQAKGLENVKVQTFHSLGYAICSWAVQQGLMPSFTTMEDDLEADSLIRQAIAVYRQRDDLPLVVAEDLEEKLASHVENLRTSISIWKGMMTTPERAEHLTYPFYVGIYTIYERTRRRDRKMTFDDMIYQAVELLEGSEIAHKRLTNRLDHIIVDEYQDVNYSKQRLVQLLAGTTAKVMVVGDDDQCIYEWTGANPAYIRRGFQETFTHFPHAVYRLSRSFRFGPAIAQTAANCIARNTDREVKELVAHEVNQAGMVELHVAEEGGLAKEPLQQIRQLLDEKVAPRDIIVLVRNYIQSYELQGALFTNGLPFFVDGENPIVNFFAVRCLRWYLSLVHGLSEPLTEETRDALLEVINRPRRYVNKIPFRKVVLESFQAGITVRELLSGLPHLSEGIQPKAFGNVYEMLEDLEAAWRAIHGNAAAPESGSRAAATLRERIDFRDIFAEFQSEARVEVNLEVLNVFTTLLFHCHVPLAEVSTFARTFDSTRGRPREECIKITSIFKEKGREYDHVILPQVVEGQMPNHMENENQATDKLYPERWPVRSSLIESERRLFYVAVTRARKRAYIFSSRKANQQVSRFIHEALIPETMAAVEAVHGVMQRGRASRAECQALCQAARHGELKNGLLNILRDALPNRPKVVEALLSQVVSVKPISFRYPEAYPDQTSPRPDRRGEGGLPF